MVKQNTRVWNQKKKAWDEYVCKIGMSSNINYRKSQLNLHQPKGSECQCLFKQLQIDASDIEQECHEHFSKYNICNEYFSIEPDLVKEFLTQINPYFEIIQEDILDDFILQKNDQYSELKPSRKKDTKIAVICQKNIQYYYNDKWQNFVRVFTYQTDEQLEKQINHQSTINRTSCFGQNYFELLTTLEMNASTFNELYGDYYINNGFYENFTDIDITPNEFKDKSSQYFKFFKAWFDQNDNPPKRQDKIIIDGQKCDIGYKWWRIVNSNGCYNKLKQKLKKELDIEPTPAFTKTDLNINSRFEILKQWLDENERFPDNNEFYEDDLNKFNLHSFLHNGLQGKYGDEKQQILQEYQKKLSKRYNYYDKMERYIEVYIKDVLKKDSTIKQIYVPTNFKRYQFTKRNWQDMCGKGKSAEKFSKIKQNLENKYNVELLNQKGNTDYTMAQLRKIATKNGISYKGINKEELTKILTDNGFI